MNAKKLFAFLLKKKNKLKFCPLTLFYYSYNYIHCIFMKIIYITCLNLQME